MANVDPRALMLDIQGKAYLPVAARVVWAREEHPDWTIHTEAVQVAGADYMRATVGDGERVLATAHKLIDPNRRGPGARYPVESAETGAIGRALGLCGYGTLAGDLDEGDELADTPIEHQQAPPIIASEDASPPARPRRQSAKQREALLAAEAERPHPVTDLPVNSWADKIEAAQDVGDLLDMLRWIDEEPHAQRRAGSLRLWAHAMADNGDIAALQEAGRQVKDWPRNRASRTEVLEILITAYNRLTASVTP